MSTAGSNYSEERTMIALTTELKRLGAVKAPPGFADRMLAQVGMADSYAPLEIGRGVRGMVPQGCRQAGYASRGGARPGPQDPGRAQRQATDAVRPSRS